MSRELRVVVADDSRTTMALLTHILSSDPECTVVGTACTGVEALELVGRLRPDVVVMDVEMPEMDGLEATKRIMMEHPTPIIVVSATRDVEQVEVGLRAVRAGALTVVPKPVVAPGDDGYAEQALRLVSLVKAMADVAVIRQRRGGTRRDEAVAEADRPRIGAVGVAASTGGPAAVFRFLEALPRSLDVPVLVVQHIASGFIDGLARWLGSATVLPVRVAQDGDELAAGEVFVAPDDRHLAIARGRVELIASDPVGGFRPSANVLFQSLARELGSRAAAVVLTGMGSDGAIGAAAIHAAGGVVLAQDDTSVVFGMPRVVADAGHADFVGPVDALAARVASLGAGRK